MIRASCLQNALQICPPDLRSAFSVPVAIPLFLKLEGEISEEWRDESVCSIVGGVACQTDVEIYLTVAKKEEQRSIDRIRVNQDSAYRTLWLRYSLAADNP